MKLTLVLVAMVGALMVAFELYATPHDAERLVNAAKAGDVETLTRLLSQAPDVDAPAASGEYPLHVAASPDIVDLLVQAGANIEARNADGETPLLAASRSDRTSTAQALIRHGASVTVADAYGFTPLHRAASRVNTTLMTMLLNSGAEVNARNGHGYTGLDVLEYTPEGPKGVALLQAAGGQSGADLASPQPLRDRP